MWTMHQGRLHDLTRHLTRGDDIMRCFEHAGIGRKHLRLVIRTLAVIKHRYHQALTRCFSRRIEIKFEVHMFLLYPEPSSSNLSQDPTAKSYPALRERAMASRASLSAVLRR